MVSQKQIQANRRNAKKSTGPKTEKGKEAVSANGLTHGLRAEKFVTLPGFESEEEYAAHLALVMADLRPLGYMESDFARRIAETMWRLRRIPRLERDAVLAADEKTQTVARTGAQDQLEGARPPTPEQRDRYMESLMRRQLDMLKQLRELPDMKTIPDGMALVWQAATVAGLWETSPDDIPLDALDAMADPPPPGEEVLVETVRRLVEGIATAAGRCLDELIKEMIAEAEADAKRFRSAKRRERRLAEVRSSAIPMPAATTMEQLRRNEVHLVRLLHKDLHELQRLQTARAGGLVAAPVAVDVEVSGVDKGN